MNVNCDVNVNTKNNFSIHRLKVVFMFYQVTKNMKRHMELHQQNRMQIPCPICSKVVLKTGMSSHMRTVHSGRKPYKCPHCDYSSAFRGNLNTHIKVKYTIFKLFS